MARRRLGLLFFVAFLALSAAASTTSQSSPRLLVHLLNYLQKDYGGAVRDGKVLDRFEYEEQLEFGGRVVSMIAELPEFSGDAVARAQAAELRDLIARKASEAEVVAKAASLGKLAVERANIPTVPERWPSLTNGAKLYVAQCAGCHGESGRGDGVAGASLEPKPASFVDDVFAATSPFHAFNAIRLGVPGTAMTAYTTLSEAESWDLAFYVHSLRHESRPAEAPAEFGPSPTWLAAVATRGDGDLARGLDDGATASIAPAQVSWLRRFDGEAAQDASLVHGKRLLGEAARKYRDGDARGAKDAAIAAYLEGLEPVEPRLRARDSAFVIELEGKMSAVRAAIDQRLAAGIVETKVFAAQEGLDEAGRRLSERPGSGGFAFSVAAGIFLREALEAALILVTLLGVIRGIGVPRAAAFVHAGWLAAVGVGVLAWFLSGWLFQMSGAQRELLEGFVALAAVLVLLYLGFWMHRRTEIGKWRAFLQEMVRAATSTRNLWILGGVAFMAVFREAFETVLFLRALLLEVGEQHTGAVFAGVGASFALVVVASALLVRYSVRLPLRQLFSLSSAVMAFLAVVLTGKAVHAFQEAGWIGETQLPLPIRSDLAGIYPTYETFLPQLLILSLSLGIWLWNRRPARSATQPST
jgi:high-affinity iron transporter